MGWERPATHLIQMNGTRETLCWILDPTRPRECGYVRFHLSYGSSCIYLAWCVGVSKVGEVVSSVGGAILTEVLEYDCSVANEYDQRGTT